MDDDTIIEMLFKIRQGILNGNIQEVCDIYNEMSGENIQPGVIISRSEYIQNKLQEKLKQSSDKSVVESSSEIDESELDIETEFKIPENAEKGKSRKKSRPKSNKSTDRLNVKNNPDGEMRYYDDPPVKPNWK